MNKFLFIFITFALLCSCTLSKSSNTANVNDTTNVKSVIIKSGGNSTIYKINSNNLIINSSYTNQYGAVNTRLYSYDDNKELKSIVKNNSVTGSETITFSTIKDRSANDKVTKKFKTISSSRGQSSILIVDYYYDENGKVIGMIQKDGNGNIIAKGVNN